MAYSTVTWQCGIEDGYRMGTSFVIAFDALRVCIKLEVRMVRSSLLVVIKCPLKVFYTRQASLA